MKPNIDRFLSACFATISIAVLAWNIITIIFSVLYSPELSCDPTAHGLAALAASAATPTTTTLTTSVRHIITPTPLLTAVTTPTTESLAPTFDTAALLSYLAPIIEYIPGIVIPGEPPAQDEAVLTRIRYWALFQSIPIPLILINAVLLLIYSQHIIDFFVPDLAEQSRRKSPLLCDNDQKQLQHHLITQKGVTALSTIGWRGSRSTHRNAEEDEVYTPRQRHRKHYYHTYYTPIPPEHNVKMENCQRRVYTFGVVVTVALLVAYTALCLMGTLFFVYHTMESGVLQLEHCGNNGKWLLFMQAILVTSWVPVGTAIVGAVYLAAF